MSKTMMVFIFGIIFVVWYLLIHLMESKIYIKKIESLSKMFNDLIEHQSIFDEKAQLINFLLKIETEIVNM